MLDKRRLQELGLCFVEEYSFDSFHRSFVFAASEICLIVDDDICQGSESPAFDYSKYCQMQNKYMSQFQRLYHFNYVNDDVYRQIEEWLKKTPDDIEINDDGGRFDSLHMDNTPLEKSFEDLFCKAYGEEASGFLRKEYSISLSNGKNAFIDYVVETKNGNFAIEENGVSYHHPCLIGNEAYSRQLEKQNVLSLYGFKVYRFSTQNIAFEDETIDSIKRYLGKKEDFLHSLVFKNDRKFKLYEHQEATLDDIERLRKEGVSTFLIVIPTGAGKSQIVIEDLKKLSAEGKVKNVLIMVPSLMVKKDWVTRTQELESLLNISIEFYNEVFVKKNSISKEHYDYIVFDEAHHAQAANCKKTLQYFAPKYLVGLTATPERLDKRKIEEIFGQYETRLTLKEAIDKNVISNIRCYRLRSNIDLSKVRYNGQDYNYADLEKTLIVDSRNELIAATIKKYFYPREDFYKQGIVFCVNVSHAKKLEGLLREQGICAKAVYGGNKENDDIVERYKNKEVQFLLSCQLISEGWDCPQTEVVVMARPTLSKVLYLQQIGRGVRNYPGKECLYVVDVVDNYESKLSPWNFNSLFKIPVYSPFQGVKNNDCDYLDILGLSEEEISMEEVDVFTFEEKYRGYKSIEQAARELFIGTDTLTKWVKKDPSLSCLSLPLGNKLMPYFSPEDIDEIKKKKKLGRHDETTLLKDFLDFIDENSLTYSFKLVFMLGMLCLSDNEGEVNLDKLLDYYIAFYEDRLNRNLPSDRPGNVITPEFLKDRSKVKKNLLANPFEKFERKRFVYFSKDLNIISFNPLLWNAMDETTKKSVAEKENAFLVEYYKDLGGV